MNDFDVNELDDVIHGRIRLGIMAYLVGAGAADFGILKAQLQATDIANQNAMQGKDLASRYDLASMDVASRAALQAAENEMEKEISRQLQLDAEVQQAAKAREAAELRRKLALQDAERAKALERAQRDALVRVAQAHAHARKHRASCWVR
jgi:hypothetical protein